MTRTLAIAVLAAVVLAAPNEAAWARTPSNHQVRAYSADGLNVDVGLRACPGTDVGVGSSGIGVQSPIAFFAVPAGARRVSLRINDDSGTRVMAFVWDRGRPVAGFCGRTAHPLAVHGGGRLWVALFDALTTTGPSIVTSGTVTATFS